MSPTSARSPSAPRHLFGLATVTGTIQVTSGEILIDLATAKTAVTATMSAASFSSGNARRDRDVRSAKFLHVEAHPELTFRAGNLTQAQGHWTLAGELTVRATIRPVTLTLESLQTTQTTKSAPAPPQASTATPSR